MRPFFTTMEATNSNLVRKSKKKRNRKNKGQSFESSNFSIASGSFIANENPVKKSKKKKKRRRNSGSFSNPDMASSSTPSKQNQQIYSDEDVETKIEVTSPILRKFETEHLEVNINPDNFLGQGSNDYKKTQKSTDNFIPNDRRNKHALSDAIDAVGDSVVKLKKKKKHKNEDTDRISSTNCLANQSCEEGSVKKSPKKEKHRNDSGSFSNALLDTSETSTPTKKSKKRKRSDNEMDIKTEAISPIVRKNGLNHINTTSSLPQESTNKKLQITNWLLETLDSMNETFSESDSIPKKSKKKKKHKHDETERSHLSTDYSFVNESTFISDEPKKKETSSSSTHFEKPKKRKHSDEGRETNTKHRDNGAKRNEVSKTYTSKRHRSNNHNGSAIHISPASKAASKSEKKEKTGSQNVLKMLKSVFAQHSHLTENSDISLKLLAEDDSLDDLDLQISARSMEESQNITLRKEELANFNVLIPWAVPALHLIETRIAGRPSSKHRESIDQLGVKIKTGNFSQEEDKQIRKNWKKFYKVHDLPNDPTPFLKFADAAKKVAIPVLERIKFARFLAHGLDNRLLCSVYNRFKRLFSKLNCGKYTEKEDKIIINYITTTSSRTPYADLGHILDRSKLSIEKRCLHLCHKFNGYTNVNWDRDFIENFMRNLVDVVKVADVMELKERQITTEEWKLLSERLDLPVKVLRQGWLCTVYPQIFISEDTSTRTIRKQLIPLLIKRGEKDWRTVNWDEVAQEFEGFTGLCLNKMLKHMVDHHVPAKMRNNLGESLDYLRDVLNSYKLRGCKIRKLEIVDNR